MFLQFAPDFHVIFVIQAGKYSHCLLPFYKVAVFMVLSPLPEVADSKTIEFIGFQQSLSSESQQLLYFDRSFRNLQYSHTHIHLNKKSPYDDKKANQAAKHQKYREAPMPVIFEHE